MKGWRVAAGWKQLRGVVVLQKQSQANLVAMCDLATELVDFLAEAFNVC